MDGRLGRIVDIRLLALQTTETGKSLADITIVIGFVQASPVVAKLVDGVQNG